MNKVFASIKNFAVAEEGVTMIEYGLIAALIAVVCITAITNVGSALNTKFLAIAAAVAAA